MKLQYLIYSLLLLPYVGLAQNEEDALRYSQTYLSGSARNQALAGSISAIGGDYSTVHQNPASMAAFNKHNFSFTPTLEVNRTSSEFYDQADQTYSNAIKIGQLSYLKTYSFSESALHNWSSLQLGAGYQRVNTFEQNLQYSGLIDSSLLHHFINEANGTSPDYIYDNHPWGAGLAYDVYAIDPSLDNQYTTTLTGNTEHYRKIRNSGGVGEFTLSASGNYQNKVYLGGTIGINRVKYYSDFTHQETFEDQDSIWLNSIEYLGNLTTEGWGANLKLGIIYLPTTQLKIGLAIHTPTHYTLKDLWGNDMRSNTDDPTNPIKFIQNEYKPTGEYDYNIITPLKTNFSFGYIFNKKGFVSAEVEYINYSHARLKSKKFSDAPYSFTSENAQISNLFTSSFNYKIGAEYRLKPSLYVRGGYAYYSTPYTKNSGVNTTGTQFITGGFGINLGSYYFDLAIVTKEWRFNYYAYNPELKGSKSRFTSNNYNFSVTIGYRFD